MLWLRSSATYSADGHARFWRASRRPSGADTDRCLSSITGARWRCSRRSDLARSNTRHRAMALWEWLVTSGPDGLGASLVGARNRVALDASGVLRPLLGSGLESGDHIDERMKTQSHRAAASRLMARVQRVPSDTSRPGISLRPSASSRHAQAPVVRTRRLCVQLPDGVRWTPPGSHLPPTAQVARA